MRPGSLWCQSICGEMAKSQVREDVVLKWEVTGRHGRCSWGLVLMGWREVDIFRGVEQL